MAKERVPPHNQEAEVAVLGALLLSSDARDEVVQVLRPEDFYKNSHRIIYETILRMQEEGIEIDVLTLSDALSRRNQVEQAGGLAYLAQLSDSVPSAANAVFYAEIVRNESLRRHLIQISQEISFQSYEETTNSRQLVEDAERKIFELTDQRQSRNFFAVGDLVSETLERIISLSKTKNMVTGLPTGFSGLDRMTSGFHPSEFIIIAARPSIGKTTFALNMATFQAIHKKVSVGFFSLEMPQNDLMDRIVASESHLDYQRLRTGYTKPSDLSSIRDLVPALTEAPLYIDDTPNMKLLDLKAQARRMKSKKDIQILFIDYISLISHENQNLPRHEQVADISRSLKALARELKIPVVALSQLSRITEEKKTPSLADLRESGSLEQDADVVLFLHRPNGRGTDKDSNDQAEQEIINTDLIIGKQRKGPIGTLHIGFRAKQTQFVNIDTDSEEH